MKFIYYLTFYNYCGKSLDLLINIFKKLHFNISIVQLPKRKTKIAVIKSPHVFNKSREHFESIIYKKLICFSTTFDENFIEKVLQGIYWSIFGISLKKKKISKNFFYLKK